ncbi:MAG: 50S ribosomal protein L24 [bacterium]
MLHIKKKDKVIVLSGKDKGKTGEVLKIFPKKGTIVVGKVNFVKKHTRGTQAQPGGIREKEAPLNIAKVMVVCSKCNKPTRIKRDTLADGQRVRMCRKCGEILV